MAIHAIQALNNWFIANRLSMNISKTRYMTFYSDSVSNSSLVVTGQSVEKLSSCKYLGLIIDDELNCRLHIENIYKKLVKYTSIFYKLREMLPNYILKISIMLLYIPIFFMVLKYMQTPNLPTLIN